MDGLLNKIQQGHVCHFMILNCMGILATANISGSFSYIKPTLEIILPTLSMIKLDHVKQAHAFGKCIILLLLLFGPLCTAT